MSTADTGRAAPRTVGDRYRLGSRIGTGASSQVHQATDLRLGRQVAVKQLRPDLTEDTRFAKLFRAEAQLAAQLSHPNILTVFDWSADPQGHDGGAYIVTELLTGGSLRSVLDTEGTVSLSQAALIGLQAARGLQAAHDAGLVHRDVKPANLLFGGDGRVHIGDFGIARAVAQAAWTEPQGVLIGTARYAAPEQANGGDVDGMADVYSLAVCLVEAITGEVPLVGENAVGTMMLRQDNDLPVDDSFGPLAEPLRRAGLTDPEQRSTAAELADALMAACRSLPQPQPLTLIDLTDSVQDGPDRDADVGPSPAPGAGSMSDPGAVERGPGADASSQQPESSPQPESLQPPESNSNVRIGPDGELIILGDDGSNLSFPAIEHQTPADTGLGPQPPPARAPAVDRSAADTDRGALGDQTSDDYVTVSHRPTRRRRRLLIGLGVFAVLAAAAGVGGWRFAEASRPELTAITVTLPSFEVEDYRGLTVEEITEAVAPYRWTVTVDEQFRDATVPGQVLSQSPGPGTRLTYGDGIELTISRGPVPRTVPELVGLSRPEAEAAIEAAELVVGEVASRFDEDVSADTVLEATIDGAAAVPGAEFLTGTPVDLVVSAGPAPRQVPSVIGLTVEEARTALAEVTLELAVEEEFSETVAEGLIISATPEADTQVGRGSTVVAVVSLGRPFVAVPDVRDLSITEAISLLDAAGFTVAIDGDASADVLATRPQQGEQVRSGSEIEIISKVR
jgi:serine/threonine-protein kinase